MYMYVTLNVSPHVCFFRQTVHKKSVHTELHVPLFYQSLYDSDNENTDEEEVAENETFAGKTGW